MWKSGVKRIILAFVHPPILKIIRGKNMNKWKGAVPFHIPVDSGGWNVKGMWKIILMKYTLYNKVLIINT